jgi:hypothetical protein
MKRFIKKYSNMITGVLSCLDRVVFRGYLPVGWADSVEAFFASQGILIKDFGKFVEKQSRRITEHARKVAENAQRPYIYLTGSHRKEDRVRQFLETDALKEGLICVLAAVESCQSFRVKPGERRPRLVPARRKCLCFYYYFLDPKLGLIHIRIQSWFPFIIQVCINGHDVLARKLDKHQIEYVRQDNAFLWIADLKRAQQFADRISSLNWPRELAALASRVNPLMGDLLKDFQYYWVIDQAEYATDVLFKDATTLKPIYDKLVRHVMLCFSAEDILNFLGRKLHPAFKGEVLTSYRNQRWPGTRVKHRMKHNWIKMYDKHGCVLRIETVINDPQEFKVRRQGTRKGRTVMDWFPMRKGVANMFRYVEVARAANGRYLNALSVVDPPVESTQLLSSVAESKRHNGRSVRGFNPALLSDIRLLLAIFRGEHTIHGIRNRDIRSSLFDPTTDSRQNRIQSNTVSRLLKRLHVHQLIAKIPRSRRWRLTAKGQLITTVMLKCHYERYPELVAETLAA